MDVNFELYKIFYHVGKKLSFSEAAAELYISQSAVSQSIKLLEDKMNCLLFIRNTKQVKLTHEGEILFQYVEQAFNFIKTGERNIGEIQSLKQGEIRIGASDTICKYYLLPYFKQFSQLYPNIKIKVTNRTSPRCIELLKKGSVNAIVVNLPEKTDKDLQVMKMLSIQDIFIAGQNFTELRDKTCSLRDLEKYPLLMLEKNTITRQFIDHLLEQRGINLTPEVELGSVDLLVQMAKIGLGISFVTEDCVRDELDRQEVFQLSLKEKIPRRSLGIITNNRIPLPAAAKEFIQLLQQKL